MLTTDPRDRAADENGSKARVTEDDVNVVVQRVADYFQVLDDGSLRLFVRETLIEALGSK
jgi:hypothetical protein